MKNQKLADVRGEDKHLQERLVAGDESVMKEIYNKYSGPLFHFARNYLSDLNDASDIVHETMMVLWQKAESFEGRSSLKSWMFSIARNKSIDRNRKGGRMYYTDEVPDVEDTGALSDAAIELSEDADLVRKCVEDLAPAYRRVIHLIFFQGMSYREVADLEDLPLGTVKTRVLHAKRKLAHLLAQKGRDRF